MGQGHGFSNFDDRGAGPRFRAPYCRRGTSAISLGPFTSDITAEAGSGHQVGRLGPQHDGALPLRCRRAAISAPLWLVGRWRIAAIGPSCHARSVLRPCRRNSFRARAPLLESPHINGSRESRRVHRSLWRLGWARDQGRGEAAIFQAA